MQMSEIRGREHAQGLSITYQILIVARFTSIVLALTAKILPYSPEKNRRN